MLSLWQRIKEALRPELNHTGLIQHLSDLNPQNLISVRIDALQGIVSWMRLPVKASLEGQTHSSLEARNMRYRFFLQMLERNEKEAAWFYGIIKEFTQRGLSIRLFCLTGLSESNNFFGEITDRAMNKILPRTHEEEDLAEIFQRIFTEEEDAEWFAVHAEQIIPPILEFLNRRDISLINLKEDMRDAMMVLTSRISAIGTSREIRKRLEEKNLAASGFIRLGQIVLNEVSDLNLVIQEINHCRQHIEEIRENLEGTGVSVDIIFQIEKLTQLLDRLEMLYQLAHAQHSEKFNTSVALLIAHLIRDEIKRAGIREFLNDNLKLITRKIVERTGERADHYIATSTEESRLLFKAGSWAGVLTGFTALFKAQIGELKMPFLIEGMGFFINYAISFLLMQYWHLALSSKIPAYTASALSKKFEDFMKTRDLHETLQEVRRIVSSQTLAATSNLLWVAPVVIILDWSWYFSFGEHVFTNQEALDVIRKHDLLHSGTLFYSFLTGILLWASSIASGMFENWLVFRNFPQVLRRSKVMNKIFDRKNLERIAHNFPSIAGAVMGNLAIAFFLAAPIVFSKITGIPLDIRHVTLAAGTITFALNSLEWDFQYWPLMISMLISVLTIGLLNFSVSFYCSIKIAALARGVPDRYLKLIYRFGWRKPKPLPSKSLE